MAASAADGEVRTAAAALGILGGTFDPVHRGHLALALEARRALELERVLFVPNAVPPHRGSPVSAPEHRAAMVALAIADEPGLVLSRIELERPGPSYAVDTVAQLAEQSLAEGRPEPWFILSVDAFWDLPSWREPARILELARVAVFPRPGTVPPEPGWVRQRFPDSEGRIAFLDGPHIDVAATTIRERVRRGDPITGLVPDAVAAYIEAHGLYRSAERPASSVLASSGPGRP